jgi:hypothetical protein
VDYGTDQAFSVSATTGYKIDSVATDGINRGAVTSYTFTNITANHTIRAFFTLVTYTLTVTNNGHGTTVPSGSVVLQPNVAVGISAVPSAGYHFLQWSLVSGTNVTIDDQYADSTGLTLTNSNATVRADFIQDGAITVSGISAAADVYLYAQSGWVGRKVLDGPGTISGLKPGNYLLSVVEKGKRTEYIETVVLTNATTAVSVTLKNAAPIVSDTLVNLSTGAGQIAVGSLASPILADFDRNGTAELLVGKSDGTFLYYTKVGGVWTAATGPKTSTGADLTVSGGMTCVRAVDWNADNRVDIVAADKGNRLVLFKNISNAGGLVFDNGTVIYTLASGTLTGFDLALLNADAYPDLVLGCADGSVKTALSPASFSWGGPTWNAAASVMGPSGAIVVGTNAAPCVVEATGDTGIDLLVANGAGDVRFFKNRNDGTYQDRGLFTSSGKPLSLPGGAAVSAKYGPASEFISLTLSDGSGRLSSGQGLLRGDFYVDADNEVNVMDLQILGDVWGKTEVDAGWVWKCNLDLTPDASGKQVIDILDLAIFGDSWLAKK